VAGARFAPEDLKDRRVVALAGIERLSPPLAAALVEFVDAGGGALILPDERADTRSWAELGWMPANLGDRIGDPTARKAVAHPEPRTFSGPILSSFAAGDTPALAEADLFSYRRLGPARGATVPARLDNGDPWIVEREVGQGRVAIFAAPFDADHGTLPVNPDFVPMAHEWIAALAGGGPPPVVGAGEPLIVPIPNPLAQTVDRVEVLAPDGRRRNAKVLRGGGATRARLDDAGEAGVYRLVLPGPAGGSVYAAVAGDPRESDPTPLGPADAATFAEGWPLTFAAGPAQLDAALAAPSPGGRQEVWRPLVLLSLFMLCAEVFLTRRIVRSRGLAG
jgi:hypothetical protein